MEVTFRPTDVFNVWNQNASNEKRMLLIQLHPSGLSTFRPADRVCVEQQSYQKINAWNQNAPDEQKMVLIHVLFKQQPRRSTLPGSAGITLEIVCCATVEYLKVCIWSVWGILPDRMQLVFAGEELKDESILNRVHFGAELHLFLVGHEEDAMKRSSKMVTDRAKELCKRRNNSSQITAWDICRAFAELTANPKFKVVCVLPNAMLEAVVNDAISITGFFPSFEKFEKISQQLRLLEEIDAMHKKRETYVRLKAEDEMAKRLKVKEEARSRLKAEEERLLAKTRAEVTAEKLRMAAARTRKERLNKAEEAFARAVKELSDAEVRVGRARNAEIQTKMEKQRDCKMIARDRANDMLEQVRRDIACETAPHVA